LVYEINKNSGAIRQNKITKKVVRIKVANETFSNEVFRQNSKKKNSKNGTTDKTKGKLNIKKIIDFYIPYYYT
jgi:hypothetical protein